MALWAKKLQIKTVGKAAVLNAPPGYAVQLGIETAASLAGVKAGSLDFIQVFAKSRQELDGVLADVLKALKNDGLLWVSYPKGSSKVKTDLNRDILWKAVGEHGMAGVSLVSLDDTWSAMRFRPAAKVGK